MTVEPMPNVLASPELAPDETVEYIKVPLQSYLSMIKEITNSRINKLSVEGVVSLTSSELSMAELEAIAKRLMAKGNQQDNSMVG